MDYYKELFIDFLTDSKALKLSNPADPEGLFTLRSGRRSPFFMNMGDLNDGNQLINVGTAYAEAVHEHFKNDFDVIFGPAYKGIPLAVSATMQFNQLFHETKRFCTNRKEIKDHGDVGGFLGAKLKDGDRIVIVEDVTTTGGSIDEVLPIIKAAANVEVVGLIVSLDRMEVASEGSDKTALESLTEKYGFTAKAIVTMTEVLEHKKLPADTKAAFSKYYEQYGVPGRKVI
jgi:orotate phosphoribosyltransferase